MLGNFLLVSFYPNTLDKKEFQCVFPGETSLNNFVDKYQNANGICNFQYDPWNHVNNSNGLPILGCSDQSFEIVLENIYPEIYNKQDKFLVRNKILKGTKIC